MNVIIDNAVDRAIDNFYLFAMEIHPSLSEETVNRKKDRLYEALQQLGDFPYMCPLAQHREDWIKAGYRVCSRENFIFAYQIYEEPDTHLTFVYIHDATHSLLYHD